MCVQNIIYISYVLLDAWRERIEKEREYLG
jgi:hypothetical protein